VAAHRSITLDGVAIPQQTASQKPKH
jgi:hypothetical protein